jgi:hypothetical protein
MLKSVYSAEFHGTACSKIDYTAASGEAEPFGLALLHSYPSFAVRHEKDVLTLSPLEGPKFPDSVPLTSPCEVHNVVGDRIESNATLAAIGVAEGTAVTFAFEAMDRSGNKAIQKEVVYYVARVDVASKPPSFSIARAPGQHPAITFDKISSEDSAPGKKTAFFHHTLEEGAPVSFNFEISYKVDDQTKEELSKPAGSVLFAQDVTVIPTIPSVGQTTFTTTFKLALKPKDLSLPPFDPLQPKPICIIKFRKAVGEHMVQLHVANKTLRALQLTGKGSIARASALRAAPVLDSFLPLPSGDLTNDYLRHACGNAHDPHLLHVLRSFASACKFFDLSSPGNRSELQSAILQEAGRHINGLCKSSFARDPGPLELVEYSAFRLLRLHVQLKTQQSQLKLDDKADKAKSQLLECVLQRVQAAWNALNLYGATVLVDTDGEIAASQPRSIHQNCAAFCISTDNKAFALVRNGFFVLGLVEGGNCISLDATVLATLSANCFCARPCVVDAKFVKGNLYLLILTMPKAAADPRSLHYHQHKHDMIEARILEVNVSHILEVKEISKSDAPTTGSNCLSKYPNFRHLQGAALATPISVGSYFPFCAFVPKFVTTYFAGMSEQLHVLAMGPENRQLQIYSVSIPSNVLQDRYPLHFPSQIPGKVILWHTFQHLSSAIVQRPGLPSRDLWVLCSLGMQDETTRQQLECIKLWRFSLQESDSKMAAFLVGEGLDVPKTTTPGKTNTDPIDLWQICLTCRGFGVGVLSPGGHFYDVIKVDAESTAVAECKWTPSFFNHPEPTDHIKYVCLQDFE